MPDSLGSIVDENRVHNLFFFFFFLALYVEVSRPGTELVNLCRSGDQSYCSDNVGSLTHCATGELQKQWTYLK